MEKPTKKQVEKEIKKFFKSKHDSSQVKKIKKLGMRYQIKLGKLRKLFCKKCYSMNLRTLSVKRGIKRVGCGDCRFVARWKI